MTWSQDKKLNVSLHHLPWTAKRSNQSIWKHINPEYLLEGLILQLKLQNFGHQMQKANSPERILMLEKIEERRRRGWQRMRCLNGIIDSMDMSLSQLWELEKDREVWHAAVYRVTMSKTWFSNWTTLCGSYLYDHLNHHHHYLMHHLVLGLAVNDWKPNNGLNKTEGFLWPKL